MEDEPGRVQLEAHPAQKYATIYACLQRQFLQHDEWLWRTGSRLYGWVPGQRQEQTNDQWPLARTRCIPFFKGEGFLAHRRA